MHWKQKVEPEATAWRAVENRARGCGLVHGQLALTSLCRPGVNRGPADAARLLADMVDAGVLRPVKYDPAGCERSVLAFRTAGPSAGQHDRHEIVVNTEHEPVGFFDRSNFHMWTFEPA